jgi:hypothetical protein
VEYLKPIFNEDLGSEENLSVDEGRVHVRERHWSPEEVLKAFGPETYEEVFDNWLEDRREKVLGKAEEILDQYEQRDRFSMLKAAFTRSAVMPFVGAGLSMSSGYPGWTKFLHKLRRQAGVPEEHLGSLLARGDYEGAAQLLSDAMGLAFNEEIENAFGCERDLQGPVQLLPYVFPSAVATTNFDDVLKRCYENATCPFSEIISGSDADELPRNLGAGNPVLIKMHGKFNSGRGRILTKTEYEAAYVQNGVLQRVVQTISARTLLFMGCSLSVDRLLSAMNAYVVAEGHERVPRHYALLSAPPDENTRRTWRTALANCNIYPIWYPEDDHDDSIEALLYCLADGVIEL